MKIRFYASSSGRSPVEEFISGLSDRLRAAILVALDEIRDYGLPAPGVSLRKIEGKLWELRVQAGSAVRLFYVVFSERLRRRRADSGSGRLSVAEEPIVIVLHGYLKKSVKAPLHELDVARRRLKEILE